MLVVVNAQSPISVATGSYYASRRDIPSERILSLSIPLVDPGLGNPADETIARANFDSQIRIPIETFLTQNGLQDSIQFIVLTPGVPLRVSSSCSWSNSYLRDCNNASVDAELAILFSSLIGTGIGQNGEAANTYFGSTQPFADWRAAHPSAPLRYLVTRLAGYQTPLDAATGVPTDVKALIDNAQAFAFDGRGLVDEAPSFATTGRSAGNTVLLGPTAALLGSIGVPLTHDVSTTFVSDAGPLVAYASWGSNDPSNPGAPVYGSIRGHLYPGSFVPGAIAADIVSYDARSFVWPPSYGQSLTADLIRLGVSGAAGHVWEPSLSGVARFPVLFRSYFLGSTAAEAFYRSVPYLGWMNVWIGDPLAVEPYYFAPTNDADGDGVPDASDDCIFVPNPDQRDTDGDGYGNLCDPDFDNNGLVTTSWAAQPYGDLEQLTLTMQVGGYDANQDLDGDGSVNQVDASIASMYLFLPPGPSGLHP